MRLLARPITASPLILGAAVLMMSGCCSTTSTDDAQLASGQYEPVYNEVPGTPQRPTEPLVIEESDLVKLDGDWLYVHNARTGLHVIDVFEPHGPVRVAQLDEATGQGGEIYALEEQALLLIDGPDQLCSEGKGTAIVSVTAPTTSNAEVATTHCTPGSVVSSRLIGDMLYVVTTGGDSGGWTSVRTFDVSTAGLITPVESERFSGTGHELHVTQRAIYVTQPSSIGGTRIQYLDISAHDGSLVVRDSIDVVGSPMGRFHMGEHEDTFRIVTRTELAQSTHLTVIDVSDPDHLVEMGRLPQIAPGEELFATRFVGDRAYIVTYEPEIVVNQVVVRLGRDPLWIVSLEDPNEPFVMSELKIPGWSDYIFPRGDRLLAVGRGDQGNGIAASLFDVSNPYSPEELTRLEFGGDNATSEANSDFRGVTVVEDQLGDTPLVVVPYTNNLGLVPNCHPEHHVQLINLYDSRLEAAGTLDQPGRVRRTLPVGSVLYVVNERAVEATDVTNRSAPETLQRIAVDLNPLPDNCQFPPAAPQRVITEEVWVSDGQFDDESGVWGDTGATLCACSTSTERGACLGSNAGWLVLIGLVGAGVRYRLRRRKRVRKAPSAN